MTNLKMRPISTFTHFRLWLSEKIYPHLAMQEAFGDINDAIGAEPGWKISDTNEYPMLVDTIKVLTDLNNERSKKMSPKDRIAHNQAVIGGLERAKFLVDSMDQWSA